MRHSLLSIGILMGIVGVAGNIVAEDRMTSAIQRIPLLTAEVAGEKSVSRVEIKRIEFAPLQKTGLHLHPIPVVGYIVKGTITFQVENEAPKTLKAGDAFFEPANKKVLHFDNPSSTEGATFIAHYLMSKHDKDLIKMLE